jgi:Beta-glucanase/Beta-glucan synthetase
MNTNVRIALLFLLSGFFNNDCRDGFERIDESTEVIPGTDRVVAFFDDFDQADGIPDKTKWILCPRMEGDPWGNFFSMSYDQAYVKDGMLILKAEKVGDVYKAGGVWSQHLFNFTYGKVEVRAKLKTAQGGLPAIWLLASSGIPIDGEIDMMEQYNNDATIHHTVHSYYTNKLGYKTDPVRHFIVPYNVGKFNVYAVDWAPDKIAFSVNGRATLTYPNLYMEKEVVMRQWPFKRPFFIILNYALSMNASINDSQLPAIMEVDWVKVSK